MGSRGVGAKPVGYGGGKVNVVAAAVIVLAMAGAIGFLFAREVRR